MRRASRCAGWVAVAALVAAGCSGGDDQASEGSDNDSDPSESRSEPAADEPTGDVTGDATDDSPEATTEEATEEPEPRTFTVAMSGDVLLHSGTWDTAEADAARSGGGGLDFGPMFADMKPALGSADLAICHLETPLATPQGPFASYPVFNAPPQVVAGLQEAGYDVCSTASNHSVDQGGDGLVRTLKTMNRADMEHFGTALSKKGSQRIDVVDVAEVPVALLNYTYGTNGIPLPSDMPWSVPLIDPERIVADAARAKREGAEVVLVSLHFGTEYSTAPDSYQTSVVDRITRSPDIDLVYGHHAHVPQPFDKVNGTWVAYGLGNFIAQQLTSMPDTYRGITARFRFRETPAGEFRVTDAAYLPTLITPYASGDPRMRVLDAAAALRDPTTPEGLRPSLQTTVAEVRAAAELLNADKHGLHLWRSWRG